MLTLFILPGKHYCFCCYASVFNYLLHGKIDMIWDCIFRCVYHDKNIWVTKGILFKCFTLHCINLFCYSQSHQPSLTNDHPMPWYITWSQGSWGQHRAYLGPTGPRRAWCWPHELCYLGICMAQPTTTNDCICICPAYKVWNFSNTDMQIYYIWICKWWDILSPAQWE